MGVQIFVIFLFFVERFKILKVENAIIMETRNGLHKL